VGSCIRLINRDRIHVGVKTFLPTKNNRIKTILSSGKTTMLKVADWL
jgi:hypothetical protein